MVRRGRSAVRETTTTTEGGGASGGGVQEDPLFGVALLKIALELKRPGAALGFEAVVSRVAHHMKLDEGEFRSFLAHQGGLLRSLAGSGTR